MAEAYYTLLPFKQIIQAEGYVLRIEGYASLPFSKPKEGSSIRCVRWPPPGPHMYQGLFEPWPLHWPSGQVHRNEETWYERLPAVLTYCDLPDAQLFCGKIACWNLKLHNLLNQMSDAYLESTKLIMYWVKLIMYWDETRTALLLWKSSYAAGTLAIVDPWLVHILIKLCSHRAIYFLQLPDVSCKVVRADYVALHMLHRTIEKKDYPLIMKWWYYSHSQSIQEHAQCTKIGPLHQAGQKGNLFFVCLFFLS